jgi:hypothetical protein
MKTIYFGIGLTCLLGGLGCKPAKEPKLQLSKEIGVYNKEVREKHLERKLDSALWYAYTTKLEQYTTVSYKNVLGIEDFVFVLFYECVLDTSKIRITRDEINKCTVFNMAFTHIYFEMCELNYLYRLCYKSCSWSNEMFCPLSVVYVYDDGVIHDSSVFECLSGDKYSEYWVCKYFEKPAIVRRMTPWLRREGVRRGYLSTDNW